ncbi:MAG: T9SS type A sorting domain-containing protein [Bacteroidales bacterium]|nr:T9SS type A sorting domain-containing protein [Bacteroidales bacterium]
MAGATARIPLEHLGSGVYFIQIKCDDIKVTKKFIKE